MLSGYAPGDLVGVAFSAGSGAPALVDSFIIQSAEYVPVGKIAMVTTLKMTNKQFQLNANPDKYNADVITRMRTPVDRIIDKLAFTVAETIAGQTNPGIQNGVTQAIRYVQKPGILGWVTLTFKSIVDGTPAGEDIVIDIFQNGVSIFNSGDWLRLPKGQNSVQRYTFRIDPLDLSVGDLITFHILSASDSAVKDGFMELVQYG
jgi:hypothetical protein